MKKQPNENNGKIKLFILIILIIGLFVLLGGAVYMYFVVNKGTVPIVSSKLKYLFLALIVLLPLLLVFLILATVGQDRKSTRLNSSHS